MKNEALDRALSEAMGRIVLFTNFTDKPFVGMWNKQEFKFKPGESKYMEYWRARHFAKHLVNQELADASKYPHGANSQSPKEVNGSWADPLFAELYNKAVKEQGEEETEIKAPNNAVDMIDAQVRGDREQQINQPAEASESTVVTEDEEEFGDIEQVK